MKKRSNTLLVKWVTALLVILLAVKLVWFAAEIAFFPVEGVNHAEQNRTKPLYYRIKLTPNKAPVPQKKSPQKPAGSIRDITLLGIYKAPDITVVTVSYKGKSKVLSTGESVNGFVLDRAGNTFAIFTKGGKEYKVTLLHAKETTGGSDTHSRTPARSSVRPKQPAGEVIDAGDHKIVDRSLLEHYTQNMDDIYKNIGIQEIKKNGKIEGFRVTFVKRGTPFAQLGLRRGDVLKAVNGEPLDSYKAAFDAYKRVKDTSDMTLTIKRGNKEMER
ncbi:MAG: PDZ domain-containing protein, partial [Sulfurovum sp.]|nr:PDZ domain-containing protein [Sulfurovum sp.]